MAGADAEYRRVITGYQTALRSLRERLARYADTAWRGLGSWRDADAEAFAGRLVPVVLAAQRRTARLTAAYLAATRTAVLGERVEPLALADTDISGAALRAGTEPAAVYRRPTVTLWTALADGATLAEAVEAGRQRLSQLVATDVQLAKTYTARTVMRSDKRVVGYRRVLSSGDSCALCVLASTQRYRTGQLSPIHPGCNCDVAEIIGSHNPGQVLDRDRLDQLHQQVEDQTGTSSRSGEGYRDIRVREHGELGPTLTWRHQDFTSAAQLD